MFKVFRGNGFSILMMVSKITLEKLMYLSFSLLSDEASLCM